MSVLRKVVFLTGTRADFGKLKALMLKLESDPEIEVHVFVTGMHMLAKYGFTADEVRKSGFQNIYKFINQNTSDSMDHILAKTVSGLADYVKEVKPDLMVIHGDRVETLAGAIVGVLNNILVAHIEGGEVSGTVDELIRHSASKLSHFHFVAHEGAKKRLIQLGEAESSVHIIGSPDIDIMNSSDLPSIDQVKKYYEIPFIEYAILLYHPVTTEPNLIEQEVKSIVDQVILSNLNYIVIYPNNDTGSSIIFDEYKQLHGNKKIKIFPSMRFEYFLSALKNASFILGNSSAGIREAPHFGVPAINVGTRQHNRVISDMVLNCMADNDGITQAIAKVHKMEKVSIENFGTGDSVNKFYSILKKNNFWNTSPQKHFVDQGI